MASLQTKSFNANHFLKMIHQEKDLNLATERDKLTFLVFGSLSLQYIFYQLHTYVLLALSTKKPQKLFFIEDVHLSTQF